MPIDPTETTGTPLEDGGDAVDSTPQAGTPQAEGRDAKSDEVAQLKQLLAAQKDKIEEANRILREQADRSSAPPSPAAGSAKPGTREILMQLASGDNPDPAAVALLEMERNLILREQLRDIPKDKHAAVKKHFEENAYRLGDYNAALAELELPTKDAEIQRLREENERLKQPGPQEARSAPPTHDRGSGDTSTTKTVPREQWDQEMAALDPFARLLRKRELNAGRIRIQG